MLIHKSCWFRYKPLLKNKVFMFFLMFITATMMGVIDCYVIKKICNVCSIDSCEDTKPAPIVLSILLFGYIDLFAIILLGYLVYRIYKRCTVKPQTEYFNLSAVSTTENNDHLNEKLDS